MRHDTKIRDAEASLFALHDVHPEESFVDLPRSAVRLRLLSHGSGPPVVVLHGVVLTAAVWIPWIYELAGYRLHLVELPGHGLSGPVEYRRGMVRDHALVLVDEILDALELDEAALLGHSLGGMFALWYAAVRPERVSSLVAIGEPAVALPGATVRMPLSLLTVPGLGPAVLRSPTPRPVYRRLLAQGLSPAAATAASEQLVDVLRFAGRRPGNARTVASLMHAINGFRRPFPENVMTDEELSRIAAPTAFCWGLDDPFLSATDAAEHIARIPDATLHQVPGGHGPWLEQPAACAEVVRAHLAGATSPGPVGDASDG